MTPSVTQIDQARPFWFCAPSGKPLQSDERPVPINFK
ncbi:hypothetical protein PS906_01584 [Pseudomonas fluorescens]|nr:hypothetical protein PS876_00078 [Pseudomonas fluorescens]VVP68303.1 hypothetical protein PS906_01584 [Pseudomonas fluorescens]